MQYSSYVPLAIIQYVSAVINLCTTALWNSTKAFPLAWCKALSRALALSPVFSIQSLFVQAHSKKIQECSLLGGMGSNMKCNFVN
jgi:hypothetical protein